MTYTDQLKRTIHLRTLPKRIISLVPSQTELLVDLGLEASMVGVTKFCVHPEYLKNAKTIVGGIKQVNIGKIKALQPDIILCNKEENTEEIIDALFEIAPIHISDIFNLEDCFELIKMYGEIFKVETKAFAITEAIQLERVNYQRALKSQSVLKVAYFIWKKPWMVAASNTFIDVMLKEAGFENSFHAMERYPEISLSDLRLQASDVIFLSSEPYPFKEKHILEFESQFPDKIIKVVDGELFSWYGSRLRASFSYFETLQNLIKNKKADM